ncbi:MAG: ATP-binding protein [Fimbriimonadaceae bacterium]|nr:ATP-binding protein [Fimbriimonadaceae bacterium]
MKIHLSNSDFLRTFERFVRTFDPSEPHVLDVTTHDKWVSVHPAVLAMVAALGRQVPKENVRLDDVTAASGHYLDRMGLFAALGKESPYSIVKHESAGRFIPLTQIRTSQEQTRFISEMIPILHLLPDQADAIKYVVGELVRNVLEHAEASSGAFVALQYHSKNNMVRLGIADTGIGIMSSISRSWRIRGEAEAIRLALTPGVTGTTRREGGTETNAGAGLFFIKSMAVVSRDQFVIYSGSGLYKLLMRDKRIKGFPTLHANPFLDRHRWTEGLPYFKGTVVAVDLSLGQTPEFVALLAAIRAAYSSAIRERKKAGVKMPRFID